mgnify:CR=1 FL=1
MGMAVNPVHFSEVSNALEEAGIDYGIWNAEEVFWGTANLVEFTVRTEEELAFLKKVITQIKNSGYNKT